MPSIHQASGLPKSDREENELLDPYLSLSCLNGRHGRPPVRRSEAEAAKAGRNATIERLAVAALAAHVQAEIPELREYEARTRAAERLRDRWADIDLEHQAQIDSNPTWETPAPRPMPGLEDLSDMALGRERAQRERERREAVSSSLDQLGRVIGG